MNTLLRTALACAVLAVSGTAALAQDIQERTIKFGHLNNADHAVSFGVKRFAELVATKSGGKLKVQVYPGGALGSDQANVSALQGGTLEMAAMNSGIFASRQLSARGSTSIECSGETVGTHRFDYVITAFKNN